LLTPFCGEQRATPEGTCQAFPTARQASRTAVL
jgi:hypothetical protein